MRVRDHRRISGRAIVAGDITIHWRVSITADLSIAYFTPYFAHAVFTGPLVSSAKAGASDRFTGAPEAPFTGRSIHKRALHYYLRR